MVFTFVISALIGYFHIDKTQAGMLGTVTLLFSALGGWIAGMLADRYGRVRILQITILWFSVCTFLIGFAQSFEQVFVLRALQGLGFGGEWALGSVLMGEIVRAQYRGRAVGTVQSGWAVGWGIAALLYTLAFSWLSEDWAWRSLFWFSVLPSCWSSISVAMCLNLKSTSKAVRPTMTASRACHLGLFFRLHC